MIVYIVTYDDMLLYIKRETQISKKKSNKVNISLYVTPLFYNITVATVHNNRSISEMYIVEDDLDFVVFEGTRSEKIRRKITTEY